MLYFFYAIRNIRNIFPNISHSTFAPSSLAQESSSLAADGDMARNFSTATEDGSRNTKHKTMRLKELSVERNINVTISLADLKAFLADIAETNRAKELAEEEKEHEVEMVSRDEASEFLKVSLCTLWRWEKEKYLIPTRKGKAVYYRRDELRAIKEGTR